MTQPNARTYGMISTAQLTLTLFGSPQIACDGLPLAFAYEKVQALLAFLAVESGRAHRRPALAALLWPDQGEAAARHNLSQALFSLRHAIHEEPAAPLLLATRDTVRLNPARLVWVDVAAFRSLASGAGGGVARLEQALALYHGEFLEGFSIGGSSSFDEWALVTREQLRAQACDLLRRLTDPQAGVRDAAHACDYAQRWAALDPLDEEAHRRPMRALAESGRRSAALVQFERCRRLLDDELGIAPELATLALYQELKGCS